MLKIDERFGFVRDDVLNLDYRDESNKCWERERIPVKEIKDIIHWEDPDGWYTTGVIIKLTPVKKILWGKEILCKREIILARTYDGWGDPHDRLFADY